MQSNKFADSAQSNIVANFYWCLSPIVSKLSTWNLGKVSWWISLTDSLVPSGLRWCMGGDGDEWSIVNCITGWKKL